MADRAGPEVRPEFNDRRSFHLVIRSCVLPGSLHASPNRGTGLPSAPGRHVPAGPRAYQPGAACSGTRSLRCGVVRGLAVTGPTGTRPGFRFRIHRIDRGTVGQRAFSPGTGLSEDGSAVYTGHRALAAAVRRRSRPDRPLRCPSLTCRVPLPAMPHLHPRRPMARTQRPHIPNNGTWPSLVQPRAADRRLH
jgi:hypothetical protein